MNINVKYNSGADPGFSRGGSPTYKCRRQNWRATKIQDRSVVEGGGHPLPLNPPQ